MTIFTPSQRRVFVAPLALLVAALIAIAVACGGDPAAEPEAPSPTPQPTEVTAPAVTATAIAPATPTLQPPAPESNTQSPPVAPELQQTGSWINSEPFTLANMQDENRVVLIDFWTYTCINCIRTLPHLRAWHDKYADSGLVILGVHTPEFEFEHDYDNVVEAVEKFDLKYPIVQDNDFGTWQAFGNRYWPTKYLIDHNGRVLYMHFGEGAYEETEQQIRGALSAAGYDVSGVALSTIPEPAIIESAKNRTGDEAQTRELYAGYERNYGAIMAQIQPPYVRHVEYYEKPDAVVMYQDPGDHQNHFLYLNGLWLNAAESITHARETRDFEDWVSLVFFGASVNVVMSPGAEEGSSDIRPYEVRIFLDDAPIPNARAGKDIMYDADGNSYVSVSESRMYFLIDQADFGGGELRLTSNSSDFSVFAFTFGSYDGGEPGNES